MYLSTAGPQYADGGKTLPAGSVVYFSGVDIKITSGKAAATLISVDGRAVGAMGHRGGKPGTSRRKLQPNVKHPPTS